MSLLLTLSGHDAFPPANVWEERILDGKAVTSLSGPKADIQHIRDYFFILRML
jgi:hypothetical protein